MTMEQYCLADIDFEDYVIDWIVDIYVEAKKMNLDLSSILSWFQYIRILCPVLPHDVYRYLTYYVCHYTELYIKHQLPITMLPLNFKEWVEESLVTLNRMKAPFIVIGSAGHILSDIRMSEMFKDTDKNSIHHVNIMKIFLFKTINGYLNDNANFTKRMRVSDSCSAIAITKN